LSTSFLKRSAFMCSKTTTFANLSEVATKRYILGLKSIISKVNIIHEKKCLQSG